MRLMLDLHVDRHDATEPGSDGGQAAAKAFAVGTKTLAEMLGVSTRHVQRMDAAGKLPCPLRLGRSVRWSVAELDHWIAAGCPDRKAWETVKATSN